MRRLLVALVAATVVAASAYAGLFNRWTVSRPSFDVKNDDALTVLDLGSFAATGTIHMSMRITAGYTANGSNQHNIWSDSDWTNQTPAGTIEDGSQTITGLGDPAPDVRRFAKDQRNDGRFIINTVSTDGNLSVWFNASNDAQRVSFVVIEDGAAAVHTVTPPSRSGNNGFIDWWVDNNTLDSDVWAAWDAVRAGDSVIIAIHQGTASYN